MPRPKPPNKVLELRGEKNKDRFLPDGVKVDKFDDIPDAPDWLGGRALNLFKHYCGLLVPLNILSPNDINSLAMFCKLEAKMIMLWQADETPSMSMYTQYKQFASDFGLTILSREKMKGPGETKSNNKYAKTKPKK